ncbi:phage tail protein, partial [Coleofasciculus sp. LEGE 07092]|uniref:phage tail protein n=1 Tax=Coleofasciculus sp. LEGE 07092 TaxID=2777969 RepID=UPI001A016C32
ALGGVSAAVDNSVSQQRAELAANPPQMESPGATATKEGSAADKSLPEGKAPKAVEKAPEGQAKPVPQPKPVPLPAKPPVAAAPSPQVTGNAEGKLDSGDAQKLQVSLRSLPTRDPGLQQVSAGSPPPLELAGDADPKQAQEQRAKLEKSVAEAHTQGQQDIAQPMGENEIYPQVPQETLRAEGIGEGGTAGGAAPKLGVGAGAGGAAGEDAVSIIAQQEKGQEIQAAVAQAQSEMAAKRQENVTKVAEEKGNSNKEITKLQGENATQQTEERAKAHSEVTQLRSDWQKEQDDVVQKSRTEADEAVAKGAQDVQNKQTEAEKKATEHIQKGEEDAAVARRKGEEDAEKERQKGKKESGGILGWLADKAKAFFDGIKQAIQKAFEIARAAVKAAIEGAQKLATAAIELGRKAIVGIIKAVGQALIAIGNVLLAAFPGLRDRFRNAIKAVVKAAETAVNTLANALKKGVQLALNLLAKGLDAALGLLQKGMMAAVEIASQAVQGAIKFADAAIKAVGAFAVLVKDIAASPGQWLSNLGAGANDGIRNHFWGAFQTAVQEWFSQKVEEVLGLGMTVWNVLKQGGINTAEVGKMAWEGIKSAIPAVLIGLLIEKVVSMIVPAAGTILLIIEGLQAAWGTVSRMMQAFDRFMVFLKAVKTGQAGPPFGGALAAAGVVVIDFVSNWLLKRLRGPASKVAGKIREIAAKIGKKIKKALKKVKRKLKRKVRKLKDKFFGKKRQKNSKQKNKEGKEGKGASEKDHPKLARQAAAELKKTAGEQKDYDILRKEKQSQAKQIEKSYTAKLKPGIKLKISFQDAATDKSDGDLDFKVVIAPNTTVLPGSIKCGSDEDLKKAKAEFGERLFSREELQSTLGVSKSTALRRIDEWKSQGKLHTLASNTFDSQTEYSFDIKKAGQREVNKNNRSKYGYSNPAKSSSEGLQILNKGIRSDSPKPILKDDKTYHMTKARYNSKRPGSSYKNFGFAEANLGHKEPGASGHWNKIGHKQSKAENRAWNKDPKNYQGPEHWEESSASGSSSERYRVPSKSIGSHSDWW